MSQPTPSKHAAITAAKAIYSQTRVFSLLRAQGDRITRMDEITAYVEIIEAAMIDERAAARKLVELCNQIIAAYPCVNRSEGKFCEHGCMTERLTDAVGEYLAMEARNA